MRARTLSLALLLALGAGGLLLPDWGYQQALDPVLLAIDRDGDGRVTADELATSSPVALPFHKVDADEDGAIDGAELLDLVLATDPANFDGQVEQRSPTLHDRLTYFPDPRPIRQLNTLLEFMAIEAKTANRRIPLPSPDELEAAARTGSLESAECQAVLAQLAGAYELGDLELPAFLQGVQPARLQLLDKAPLPAHRAEERRPRPDRPPLKDGERPRQRGAPPPRDQRPPRKGQP